MSAGDFLIRRNNAETDSITTANFDSTWDTEVYDEGGTITYSAGTFTVGSTAPHLILFNERFETADVTNNERIEIQAEILVNNTAVQVGRGQDYIRKSSGHQSCIVSGFAILELTASDDIDIRFYRTDNSTTGTVDRTPGFGGVQILELDDTDNFGIYSTNTTTATTGTLTAVSWNTNDREDSPFTRTGANIDISTAGRYLVCVSGDLTMTTTARTEVFGELRLNGTAVPGTRVSCYMRGADGCQDGALSGIHIIDVAAGEDLSFAVADIGGPATLGSGFGIQVWQIPSGGTECIVEATNGDMNVLGDFSWDTNPFIDTADFTHTTGQSNIDVDQTDHYLVVSTMGKTAIDTAQRPYPIHRLAVNNTGLAYGSGGAYHRNSGGTGLIGITTASIAPVVNTNGSLEIEVAELAGASGTVDCDSGQFAVLNLGSLYSYTYPPIITDAEDEQFDVGEANVLVDGERFEAVQGTGVCELADGPNYATATKVSQTINSWGDTQLDIDITLGALAEGVLYLFVTNDSGDTSPAYLVNVGRLPYDNTLSSLSPDHLWMLDNTYDDDAGSNDMTTDIANGGGAFVATPICRSNTHAWEVDNVLDRRGCADSNSMNIGTPQNRRTMGGWIQLGTVQQSLACLYKEGGGVNNACFLIGIGNSLVAQVADTSDFTVQAYSDFRLAVDRPYHIVWRFEASGFGNFIKLFIDGIEQARSNDTPDATDFDNHSGDINWGDPDSNLEMGGSDVAFAGSEDCLYAAWLTFSGAGQPAESDIFDEMFLDGALPDDVLASGTEAAMQTALDGLTKARPDWPVSIEVPGNSGDSNFELTLNDVVFDDRITVQLVYRGSATLTVRNSGTSNLVSSKVETPGGGTVTIVETAPITITVLDIDTSSPIENARVFLEADAGGPLAQGTNIINALTNASGQVTAEIDFSSTQPVLGRVRRGAASDEYRTGPIGASVTSDGLSLTVLLVKDR
jgi:hypothetical protein